MNVADMNAADMSVADMNFASVGEQMRALHTGAISAVELLDASIAQIAKFDANLNAVVVRDFERARTAAHAADAARAHGDQRALLGLPMTVKESFNVAGLPTTWGIPGTEALRIESDSVAVARLRAAGAVILGKTNVAAQLGDWQCANPVYGVTNNPWDLQRTPGGSSGGSAASLAAGYVALELGSDLNGSLRVPAHFCGVFAHRPTFALTPTRGQAPPGTPTISVNANVDFATVGPMARTADDLKLALSVLAGPDDAEAVAYRLQLPQPRAERLQDLRVLVLLDHPLINLSVEVRRAFEQLENNLQRIGCKTARASPLLPDLTTIATTFGRLLMAFFGADMPAEAYEGVQQAVRAMPADQGAELRNLVLTHRDWVEADRMRVFIAHQWRQLFKAWDVVVCPVCPTAAFPHDHSPMATRRIDIDGTSMPYELQAIWNSVAAVGGLPATALPIGRSSQGLPIGAQVIGPHLEDLTTLQFASLIEREWGGFVAPRGF